MGYIEDELEEPMNPSEDTMDMDFDIEKSYETTSSSTTDEEKNKEKEKYIDPFAYGAELAENYQYEVHTIKLPDWKIRDMYETYGISLVNDFDDNYNLSDEELQKISKYYKYYKKIMSTKKTIRNLSTYVATCRNILEFIKVVAKDNIFYDEEEFVEKVLTGKIVMDGVSFPKYKGKMRKRISWEAVARYIMNPDLNANELDASLKPVPKDEVDEDEYEGYQLTNEEMQYILKDFGKPLVEYRPSSDITAPSEYISNVIITTKELRRDHPDIEGYIEEKERSDRIRKGLSNYYGSRNNFVNDDIAAISREAAKRYKKEFVRPVFEGDIMDEKDYEAFMTRLEEWENEHDYIEYNGRRVLKADATMLELKTHFEALGYNVNSFYQDSPRKKKEEAMRKMKSNLDMTKLHLQLAQQELDNMVADFGSEEAIYASGGRYAESYDELKKKVKRFKKDIARIEDRKKKQESMSTSEYSKFLKAEEEKRTKKERKRGKKKPEDEKDSRALFW